MRYFLTPIQEPIPKVVEEILSSIKIFISQGGKKWQVGLMDQK